MAKLPMSSTAFASSATNGREPPLKKKKPSGEPTTILSLPYDLLVTCLARVSRLYYPTLSLVSKSFRSLIASPEIYHTRNLLGRTESCLYVCLRFPFDPNPRWFTLYHKPNKTLTNKKEKEKEKSSGNVLAPIRVRNSSISEWSNLVVVGPYFYAIRGSMEDPISFIDCRTHMWLEAPKIRIAHTNSLFDGKMYLPGCYENLDSLNCIEVFNSKTQTWNQVPPGKRIFKRENMEGKIYMELDTIPGNYGMAYNAKEMTGEPVGLYPDLDGFSSCMIHKQKIVYSYVAGGWSKLKGLVGLPMFPPYSCVKLMDYGGKLLVLWDEYVADSGDTEKMIWCAEISLERRNKGEEIWGKVEWFDAVLRVPNSYKYLCAIVATL